MLGNHRLSPPERRHIRGFNWNAASWCGPSADQFRLRGEILGDSWMLSVVAVMTLSKLMTTDVASGQDSLTSDGHQLVASLVPVVPWTMHPSQRIVQPAAAQLTVAVSPHLAGWLGTVLRTEPINRCSAAARAVQSP